MKISSLFIFAFLLSVSFVSAQYYGGYGPSYGGGFWGGTEQFINSIVQILEPLLRALLGGDDWTGYLLFEKTLLFILITIIVSLVLTKLPVFEGLKNKGILRLVAIIVALLGVRGLNFVWINTILVQYQALFITVAGILPFMIYWMFLQGFTEGVKKVGWSLYGVIYLGLWITNDLEAHESVYLWGAIIAFVYGFFIDKSIQKYLDEQRIKAARSRSIWLSIEDNNDKIRKLNSQLQNTARNSPGFDALKNQIADLNKHNKDLAEQAR